MKKIKIIALKKEKNKYVLETSEGSFILDENTIIKFYLFKNKELTKDELNTILQYSNRNKYLNKALNYLSYKMRSIYEVRTYLIKQELNDFDIEEIIRELKKMGYLNDNLFMQHLFDYCLRNYKGPMYLKSMLEKKQVAAKIISEALSKYNEELEIENIKKIITKEMKKIKTYPLNKQRQKLYAKLIRSGFNPENIGEVLSSFPLIDESENRLKIDFEKILKKYQKKDLSSGEVRKVIVRNLLNKGYEYQQIITFIETVSIM